LQILVRFQCLRILDIGKNKLHLNAIDSQIGNLEKRRYSLYGEAGPNTAGTKIDFLDFEVRCHS
jgi:hypothetical protein